MTDTSILENNLLESIDLHLSCESKHGCSKQAEWISQFIPCMHLALLCTAHKERKEIEMKAMMENGPIICIRCEVLTRVERIVFLPL